MKKTESLDSQLQQMKKNWIEVTGNTEQAPIVIADECGDSLWDEVLQQEVNSCMKKEISKNVPPFLNRINGIQVGDTKSEIDIQKSDKQNNSLWQRILQQWLLQIP